VCRAADSCTELGTDSTQWSKKAPLLPPKFFDEALEHFVRAYRLAEVQDLETSLVELEKTRSDDLRDWFVEHGQMSGWHHRVKGLNLPKPAEYMGPLETERSIKAFEASVYVRDGYMCRYCSLRVIDTKSLIRFEKWVGSENFKVKGKGNQVRHGVALVFRATADHVVPISHGGRTNLENLVTSCWSCNYGKYNALVEQMGLDDPRERPAEALTDWNGLM
jgi:hypothetical protein